MTTQPPNPPESEEIPVARPAATVVLVRDTFPDAAGECGVEVFVVRRTAGAAFAAGFYVFPGGKVDEADGGPSIEHFCTGIDDATASATLGVDHGGLAYWVAAIRECFEEAGVLIARRSDGGDPAPDPRDRERLHSGEVSLVELCRRDGLLLDAGALRYVAHWVTPERERPRRFDTRFFVAAAPVGQEGSHDDGETVDSRWVKPAHALAQADAGELMLMPPTIAMFDFLDGCADVAAVLERADSAGRPPTIMPVLNFADDGVTVTGVTLPDGSTLRRAGRPRT